MKHTEEKLSKYENPEYEQSFSLTPKGVEHFLSSSWVEGIGPAYARRLVEKFGTDAVHILMQKPQKAEEIPGLGQTRVATASESLINLKYPADLIAFLFSCGIGDTYIRKIIAKYRKHTPDIITKDPYSMIEDVWRLTFFTADKIGRRLGIPSDDPHRLRGALLTAIKQYAEAGHLFATPDEAVSTAARISGSDPDKIQEQIDSLADEGRIVKNRGGLYLPVFYNAEKDAARKLSQLTKTLSEEIPIEAIPTVNGEGLPYSPIQREAIQKALNSPVMVLTGGPGSGKTTVLRGVIETLEKNGKKVVLAAPTGRAAKRMTALTGVEASTIHRLLGYREGQGWLHRPIFADVLIIDEGSMMEQVLFDHLLEAVRPGTRIILVGDVDQLPAIGAGDVLRDLIDAESIPVAKLTENFRQAEGSMIARGAKAVNEGVMPESDPLHDFIIISEPSVKAIHDRIIKLMAEELPRTHGISPTDIQVVSPQQIGPLGARQLNADIQQALNPEGPALRYGSTMLRLRDPVMQTANSRERGVYNGEIGRITEVNTSEQWLNVEFSDGRESRYLRRELSEITLAYATTVHKLQGSEVNNMIFPITMSHKPMLYRNLLYTAISRASRLCVLVGEEEALRYAIGNNPATTRNTNFRHRLDQEA